MRTGEAVALKRIDVLPERKIYVQRALDFWRNDGPPKNGEARYVDISEELYRRLVTLPCLPESYLFKTAKGLPYTTNTLSHLFREAADKLGLRQVTIYTAVRHSTATLVKKAAEEKAIAEAAAKLGNTAQVARIHYIQQ
jgi:integrase